MQTKAGGDFVFEVPELKSVPRLLPPAPLCEVPVPSLRALEIQSIRVRGKGRRQGGPIQQGLAPEKSGLSPAGSKDSTQAAA